MSEAILFAAMAVIVPLSVAAAFPLSSGLANWVDVGLHPHVLQVNGKMAGGIMGGGRQRFLGESHSVRGWYDSNLPVAKVAALMGRTDGAGEEVTASVSPQGDRTYFEASLKGAGTPNVFLDVPGSPSLRISGSWQSTQPLPELRGHAVFFLLSLAGLLSCLCLPRYRAPLVLCALLATAELFEYSLHWVPSVPKDAFVPRTPLVDILQSDASLFRSSSFEEPVEMWRPASGSLFGLHDLRGYDALDVEGVAGFQLIAESLFRSGQPQLMRAARTMEGLANAKYFFSSKPWNGDDIEPVLDLENFHVYRSKRVLPRAFVFENTTLISEAEQIPAMGAKIKDWIASQPEDFESTLPVHDPELGQSQPTNCVTTQRPRDARILNYSPDRVIVEAVAPCGGFLFLSDAFFPGWHATVDSQPREIYRAWIGFRTVRLEPGTHRVVFEYKPLSFRIGLLISALAWAIWLALFVRVLVRSPANPSLTVGEWTIEGIVLVSLAFWAGWEIWSSFLW
ncbi:MAG: YfhO family protein [Elusimicrobia bacterium]|nr:YfhO family protein [Elusimicrobiota bacterium]